MLKKRGMAALQIWASRVTSPYACVTISDMTTSWRDGRAFCAIIHKFRPDLIKHPDDLNPEDVFGNNKLAFDLAEEHLDVSALLDPQVKALYTYTGCIKDIYRVSL